MTGSETELTQLLLQAQQGDSQSHDQLLAFVYPCLKKIARNAMRKESPQHTLQPTALVHEAYIQLFRDKALDIQSRSHFFALAAKIMRQILVSHARGKQAARRGGNWLRLSLEEADAVEKFDFDILALEEQLTRLQQVAPRQCRVVELRYFAGLTLEEVSNVTGMGISTITKDIRTARAWLQKNLENTSHGPKAP